MSDDTDDDLEISTEPENIINYYASLKTTSQDELRRLVAIAICVGSSVAPLNLLPVARGLEHYLKGGGDIAAAYEGNTIPFRKQ
jgi:hypothetical protein